MFVSFKKRNKFGSRNYFDLFMFKEIKYNMWIWNIFGVFWLMKNKSDGKNKKEKEDRINANAEIEEVRSSDSDVLHKQQQR